MGNTLKPVLRHFTAQVTYSSSGENSNSNSAGGNCIVEGAFAEHSRGNSQSCVSSFVAIEGSHQDDVALPDSGWVSAEAVNSVPEIHETGMQKEEESEKKEKLEGRTQQKTDGHPVFPVPSCHRQPVQHSSNSTTDSPLSSSGRSPNSNSTDSSDGRASTSTASSQNVKTPLQESCWTGASRRLPINRREVLKEILDKISGNRHGVLKVPIPTCARRCHAKLTCNFISYVQELTDWPDRFCRLTFHLNIPKKCVEALTISNRCTIVITINVSSSARTCSNLLDGRCPLTLRRVITPGIVNMELIRECEVVRHTTLFDAHCVNFHVAISARFELQEVKYMCDEEGLVTMEVE